MGVGEGEVRGPRRPRDNPLLNENRSVTDYQFDICVVGGCGHVGLPLAITFAQRGLNVSIYDINERAVETVRSGRMPFLETGAGPALRKVIGETLNVANDPQMVSRSRHVIVVIGTPVDEHLNPTFYTMRRFFATLLPYLRDGQCLILRSTVYPGTTEKVRAMVEASGKSLHIAFCPERVAQGKAMEELTELPQIVSGCDEEAVTMAGALFGRIAKSIITMAPLEAELTKIFANVSRYIQFATANQFLMIAADFGVDFYKIHDALTRDYPRMAGLPKGGFAAGPCLFKDTMQLAAANNNTFSLGHSAMLINEGLPNFLVRHAKLRYDLATMRVGVLGMAFKGGERRPARVALVQAPQDPRVRGGRGPLHRRLHRRSEVLAAGGGCPTVGPPVRGDAPSRLPRCVDPRGETRHRRLEPVRKRGVPLVKIMITGAAGFIAGYLVEELLAAGHEVVGLDNHSKYGPLERGFEGHPRYHGVTGDAKDVGLLGELLSDCDHFVAGAAIIGGITLFHERAYDLIAENERITAAAFDAAIRAHKQARLAKITVVSSSMVYESATVYPTPEGEQRRCPPPRSTYGFQKLATEYFAQGAHEQYGLPYTIVRPFNCIGVGEKRALSDRDILSGNIKLAMSHVVPDLAQKVLKAQDPLHLLGDGRQVRHYTYGGDLARGIRLAIESPSSLNEDFNLSTDVSTTVHELAAMIWRKVHGDEPFRWVCDTPYTYDVQKRVPDVEKARRLLGFEAKTSLSEALDEVIPWIRRQIELEGI